MITVRPAQASEADALGAVMYDAVHTGRSLYTEAQRTAWVPTVPGGADWAERLQGQHIWVAEQSGALAGFVSLAEDYVDFAYVRAAAQGRGVMRALMTPLEASARAARQPRLWTHASLMAQPAFAALGFHVIRHETVERRGQHLDRAEMEKRLT